MGAELAMSTDVLAIRVVRSSTVASGISNMGNSRWSQKNKSKRLKSRERNVQATDPQRLISPPPPRYVARRWLRTAMETGAGAPS
ncbi:hypothetical protein TNCV_3402231 [Trichonephila clavipes]|nr:hypothetical protein TNCV_3402231 [Trichonephila clavipes]